MKQHLALIALLLFILPMVSADYHAYTTYGNDNGLHRNILGNIGTNYAPISPNIQNTGSFTEAITYDFDGDGTNDIILAGFNNSIILVEGNRLNYNADILYIGNPEITGVACDFQNTGTKRQYVGIFQNTSGERNIVVVDISNGQMTVVAQEKTNTTNVYGNIICTDFYRYENGGVDTKNYLFWLDANKYFHEAYYNNGDIVEVMSNPEDGVTKELSGTYTFNGGSHTIALSDGFKQDKRTLAYTAGDYIIGITSDGSTFQEKWQNDIGLAGNFQSSSRLHIFGDVDAGNGDKGFLIVPSTSLPNGGNQYAMALYYEKGFFDDFTLANRLADPNPTGSTASFEVAPAIHDINYDGKDELYYQQSSSPTIQNLLIYSMNNLSANTPILSQGLEYIDTAGFPPRIYVMTTGDLITLSGTGTPNASIYLRGTNYTTKRNIGLLPVAAGNSNNYPPQPIQLDNDGYMDFLYTSPAATLFFIQPQATTIQNDYPFTVTLNNTLPYTAVARIHPLFNNTAGIYNYAAICDMTAETIYNEQFGIGYNFSERHVITSAPIDPENYLTYFGYRFDTNITYFDVRKINDAGGARDIIQQTISYQSSAPNVMLYFAYASDSQRTYTLKLNYTGSIVIVSEYQDSSSEVYITNYSINAGQNTLNILYTPKTDLANGINYFTTDFIVGNTTIASSSTYKYFFGGSDLKDAELYTDTPNVTITLSQIGLFRTNNPHPPFVQFQNGQIITSSGVTFTNPPPVPYIQGDNFAVIADYNDQFYGVCTYDRVGTYTQRHFMSATNVLDWSNYRTLTVTVTNTSSGAPTDEGQGGLDNPPAGENIITSFFQDLGVTDTATAFVIWMFLTLIVAGYCFALNPAFGILAFVAMMMLGVFLGMMPLWVIILFVIIAGAIFVTVYRKVTSGD